MLAVHTVTVAVPEFGADEELLVEWAGTSYSVAVPEGVTVVVRASCGATEPSR